MKIFSLLLSFCLVFSSIENKAFANVCSKLFESERPPLKEGKEENAGNVLLDIFKMILQAPNNSRVKIFTKTLNFDGVGSLLLMVAVNESRKERGLKFDFYLENPELASRIHDLYVERSTNKIHFKNSNDKFLGETFIVVENHGEIQSYQFQGDLTSNSLKDASLKMSIPVKYVDRNHLRASPFRNIKGVLITDIAPELLGGTYPILHTSKLEKMTEDDMLRISVKAFDLALQLHLHKKGKVPKQELSSIDILNEVFRN